MAQKLSTRALTESSLMTGLAVLFALLGMVPVVGALTILICGIPITVAAARHGSFAGGLSAVLATLLIALFLGPISAISYGLENMLLGFVIGYMLNKRKSGMKILQSAVMTAGLAALVVFAISFALMGFSPDAIAAYYTEMETSMLEMYESSGMVDLLVQQGNTAAAATALLQSMVALVIKISPATMMLLGGLNGAFVYWLTMVLLKRLKVRIPRNTHITSWHLPFNAVWFIIVVWALWLMGDRIPVTWIHILTLNCGVVCLVLLFLNGLTTAMHMLHFKELSTGMRIMWIFLFFMFFTVFIFAFIILGIADLLFDFRKKKVDNNKVG